jgi:hypothetical protein
MKTQALRRHHEQRIKQKVKHYYGGVFKDNPRKINQLTRTHTPCSCFMCGNPRRYQKTPTLREIRQSETLKLGKKVIVDAL